MHLNTHTHTHTCAHKSIPKAKPRTSSHTASWQLLCSEDQVVFSSRRFHTEASDQEEES